MESKNTASVTDLKGTGSDGKASMKKTLVVVRMKPIGKGETD